LDDGGIGGGEPPISEGASGLAAPGVGGGGVAPGIGGSGLPPIWLDREVDGVGAAGMFEPPAGCTVAVEGGGGTVTGAPLLMPGREAPGGVPKWSLKLLGAGGGVESKPRLSIGRSVLCTVGEPPGSGAGVAPGAGGVVATGSPDRAGPPLIGMAPPETVEKPVAVGSGPFTVADDGVTVAGVPLAAGVVAAVLLVGTKVDVGTRLLLLRQQSQPTRAIPAQARPIRPITGFLPIGSPFPRRDEPRARQPLRGREVGVVTRIQSSPVID
jgi:hypothetical protein